MQTVVVVNTNKIKKVKQLQKSNYKHVYVKKSGNLKKRKKAI